MELHWDTISQRYVKIQIKRQWNKAYATVWISLYDYVSGNNGLPKLSFQFRDHVYLRCIGFAENKSIFTKNVISC